MTTILRGAVLAAFLALPVASAAQTPAVSVAYERRHDRYSYRFENPSRFDTAELVPHFFEQQYRAHNHWIRATARIRAGAVTLDTLAAVSAPVVTYGDDFDTFFQPDGDVVRAGTSGDVTLQSWRLRQRVFLPSPRLGVHIGYSLTRDRARFHAGNKVTTHTIPPSSEHSVVTTRETTWSQVHEILFGIEPGFRPGAWLVTVSAAGGTGVAQLTVQLPDKYPGVDLRFPASIVIANAGVSVERQLGAVAVLGGVDYVHTWTLHAHSQFRRRAVSVNAGIGWRR